jgi:ABC-type glycerol-3-phosphate transport system substrate-binding protein
MKTLLMITATLLLLSACGEKPQALVASSGDAPAYTGATTGVAFTAPGWKAGDKTAWEQQLKARQLNSQNDYSRIN